MDARINRCNKKIEPLVLFLKEFGRGFGKAAVSTQNAVLNIIRTKEHTPDVVLNTPEKITEYTVGLQFVDFELSEVKENLYIAFANYSKDKLPFYNTDLYKLKNKVEADVRLEKYLENNAH